MGTLSPEAFLSALFIISSVPLLISLTHWYKNASKNCRPTGPKPHPLLGSLPDFIRNRNRFLDWVTEVLAATPNQTMVFHNPCQPSMVLTANPSVLEHFLKTNFDNYPKGKRMHDMVEDLFGNGIFNSDGEHWKAQRKTASFEFNKRSLRNFVVSTVQSEITGRLLPLLRRAGDNNEVVDLQDVLQRFAFDNICKVAFGVDPATLAGEEADLRVPPDFMKAFDDAAKLTADRFFDVASITWRVKRFLNIGSERRLRESAKVVRDFAVEIIRARKEESHGVESEHHDLLSRFMSSGDQTEEFLRDNVVNFLGAGRDTTSSSMSWFFWLVSSRPEVEKKILEEVASIRARNPDSGGAFSFDELREMHYLHSAITESMRLYPPVPIDSQSCLNDDVLPDGTFVGKGWVVSYLPYCMGRMEAVWGPDCREYRPERWVDEDGAFRPESPFKYPVFHAGPRMCLGKEMAYIQMKSVVASVLERFEIEVVEKEKPPEQVLSITLRMKDLRVKVKERVSRHVP